MPVTSVSLSALYGIPQFCIKQYNNFEWHEEHEHIWPDNSEFEKTILLFIFIIIWARTSKLLPNEKHKALDEYSSQATELARHFPNCINLSLVIIKFSIRRYSDCLCLKLSLVEGWGETRQTHQKYYACSVNFSGSAISDLNQDTWFSHLFPTTKCSSIASQSILKVLRKGRSSVMIK